MVISALGDAGLLASKVSGVWRGLAFAVEALSCALVGRLGAVAGASFEATGRLVGDIQADVNTLIIVLLVVRARVGPTSSAPAALPPTDVLTIAWKRDFELSTRLRVDAALAALATACELADTGALLAARGTVVVRTALSCYPADALWSPACWQHVLLREVLDLCPAAVWACHELLEACCCKLVSVLPAPLLPSASLEYVRGRSLTYAIDAYLAFSFFAGGQIYWKLCGCAWKRQLRVSCRPSRRYATSCFKSAHPRMIVCGRFRPPQLNFHPPCACNGCLQ